MERLFIELEFLFDEQAQLFPRLNVYFQDEPLSLSLSELSMFLYDQDNELLPEENDFLYGMAKFIKKVRLGDQFIYAIPHEHDMALFLKLAKQFEVPLFWMKDLNPRPIQFDDQLPFTVTVDQQSRSLVCHMSDREAFIQDPLAWLTFECDGNRFCFSHGHVVSNPPQPLEDFLLRFLDESEVTFSDDEALSFIQTIYTPYKSRLFWQIKADFDFFIPQQVTPVPVLSISHENNVLMPTLSFRYNEEVIGPDYTESTILDRQSGQTLNRAMDMEAIYQQDLMTLFEENSIPFLLQSPQDKASFIQSVVPLLMDREWDIHSNITEEFKVVDTPVDLEFRVSSQDNDWFYFEPNCDVGGQEMSLQELARLMVQNQGFIKTKQGYVKVSKQSQEELSLLANMDALRVGKQFRKAELLPMLSATATVGTTDYTKSFVEDAKQFHALSQCEPSDDFNGDLRSYQQYGVNWIQFLAKNGLGGVLADDMGLGKTIQSIAFSSQWRGDAPILIIGPTNVIYNWESEFKKFLPDSKILVYTGSGRYSHLESLANLDFLITSFGIVKNDLDWMRSIHFRAIIVDEAQFMKNPKAQVSQALKSLSSDFRLAMTGTPIENHLLDLWNLMDFVMPGYLGNQKEFDVDLKSGRMDIVKARVKPFILRREKEEVLHELPDKVEVIQKCPLTLPQKQLYETVLKAVKSGVKGATGKKERLNILTGLLKLRQVCTHPDMVSDLPVTGIPSAKFEMVKDTVSQIISEGHKVVVFSQFTLMLDILEKWIQSTGCMMERIDGSVSGKARIEATERFNGAEGAGIFLISLKAGGTGINLTAASYVIHLDPWWNPAIESQATDRVHRMGQTQKVMVYKFITEGTIEEKIYDLQEQKKQLIGDIIDIDSLDEKSISMDEIRALL